MAGHRRCVEVFGAGPKDLHPILGPIQGAGVDTLRVRIAALDEVQESFSAWKELRITVPGFLAASIGFGQEHRDTACGRDAVQSLRRPKKNDAVAAPSPAHRTAA